MASNRQNAARHLPGKAVVPLDEDTTQQHTKPQPQDAKPPRAGRTGGLGTRAERPADGGRRKADDKLRAPGRGAKAPSARKSAHSDDRSSK
jgi:hypothetical protein